MPNHAEETAVVALIPGAWFPGLEANQGFLSLVALLAAFGLAFFEHFRGILKRRHEKRQAFRMPLRYVGLLREMLKAELSAGNVKDIRNQLRNLAELYRVLAQGFLDDARLAHLFLYSAAGVQLCVQAVESMDRLDPEVWARVTEAIEDTFLNLENEELGPG